MSWKTKKLRRAGLDYHEWVNVQQHESLAAFIDKQQPHRLFALTTKGSALYSDAIFADEDVLLFGPETRGLPSEVLTALDANKKLYLPMQVTSRSLNLSNTVAVVLFEAWKQLNFSGGIIKS